MTYLKSGRESEDRLAIIEADWLFEKALKTLGYEGRSFVELIKNLKPWHVDKVEEVKKAHEIRNRLVHEPGYHLTHFEAEMAIKIYEKALAGCWKTHVAPAEAGVQKIERTPNQQVTGFPPAREWRFSCARCVFQQAAKGFGVDWVEFATTISEIRIKSNWILEIIFCKINSIKWSY